MATKPSKTQPIVVIVGPTASGKSSVAIKLSRDWPVEVICADSRTLYRGADIGTAKPSASDLSRVKHWGLDLVEPGQRFSIYDFNQYAGKAIKDITSRNKIPTIVGGSGLYVDSLIYNYQLLSGYSTVLREYLEKKSVKQLQDDILSLGHELPADPLNKHRLLRVIEAGGRLPAKGPALSGVMMFGIWPSEQDIKHSISARIEKMYSEGFESEVYQLVEIYGKETVSGLGIGYSSCISYLEGGININEAKVMFATGDWQYVRRQRTWFKRNKDIVWSDTSSECYNKVIQFLNKNCSN